VKKIITVDGPAGSGKEKISRYIARKYKLYHLDSGLLYRKLAYELVKKNIKTFEVDKIKKVIKNIKKLSLRKTQALRKEQIGKAASEIAKLNFVRYFIAPLNVNYHIEHHLFMFCPWYNLPKAHEMLKEKDFYKDLEIENGYFNVFKKVII